MFNINLWKTAHVCNIFKKRKALSTEPLSLLICHQTDFLIILTTERTTFLSGLEAYLETEPTHLSLKWGQPTVHVGLLWWLSGKEHTCNAGDLGVIPGPGRFPREGNGNPFQYSCWESLWSEEPGRLQSVLCCAQLISCFWHFSTPWTAAARLLCPWDSPGKNTGVGCHALLQGIFLTQSSNPGILHCRWILYHLYHLSYQQSPGYSLWGRNRVGGDLVTKQQQQQSVHIYDLFLVPALV